MDTNAKIFPKPIYDTTQNQTNYSCEGSCTCKFLKNRTEYDKLQFLTFEKGKNIIYPTYKSVHLNNINTKGWLSS